MKYKICSKVLNQDEMGKAAQELNEQLVITPNIGYGPGKEAGEGGSGCPLRMS